MRWSHFQSALYISNAFLTQLPSFSGDLKLRTIHGVCVICKCALSAAPENCCGSMTQLMRSINKQQSHHRN